MKNITVFICLMLLLFTEQAEAKFYIIEQTPAANLWQFVSSSPGANAALDTPPSLITITFSQAVKPEGSFIKVYDPYNNLMNTGDISVKNTSISTAFSAPQSGSAGTYHVEWQATCQCNNTTVLNSSFYFTLH